MINVQERSRYELPAHVQMTLLLSEMDKRVLNWLTDHLHVRAIISKEISQKNVNNRFSVYQSIKQSVSQSVNQSVSQSINQSFGLFDFSARLLDRKIHLYKNIINACDA
jgi:ABC-type uncharacterized transport system fused permease/ATPase subunit